MTDVHRETIRPTPARNLPPGRIALVSSGLTHVRRGFETFILDLHHTLRDTGRVTLLKGSGEMADGREHNIPTLTRNGDWMKRLGPRAENERYRLEQWSMTLSGWLGGHWSRCDIIQFCDPALGGALLKLKRAFGYRYKLLFSNCGPARPEDCARFDFIQQFSPCFWDEALAAGIPETKMFLLPMGVRVEDFASDLTASEARTWLGIPQDKFVLLCVGSLDEPYKRIQWLIEAVAALDDPDVFLVLAGQNEDTAHARETLALAETRLPRRHKHVSVPYEEIPLLYRAADVFALGSLQEGFGKVYLEAMASRTPLICHDTPHTRWIVADDRSRINLEDTAAFQAALRRFKAEPDEARDVAERNYQKILRDFQWTSLESGYLEMYDRILRDTRANDES